MKLQILPMKWQKILIFWKQEHLFESLKQIEEPKIEKRKRTRNYHYKTSVNQNTSCELLL